MIVPGEASESDEDELTPSASSAPPNVVPILPKSAVAQTPSPTASSGATIASQLTSKVNSVTEAAVKQFGNLSRQVRIIRHLCWERSGLSKDSRKKSIPRLPLFLVKPQPRISHRHDKQPFHFKFQATLDDFMTGVSTVYYSTASNTDSMTQEEIVGEREQSLLHAKLFEKNASLSRNRLSVASCLENHVINTPSRTDLDRSINLKIDSKC